MVLFAPVALFAYVDCLDNINGCGTTELKISALQTQIAQLTQMIAQLLAQKGTAKTDSKSVTWGGYTMQYPASWSLVIDQQETVSSFVAVLKDSNGRTIASLMKFFGGGDSPLKVVSSATLNTKSGITVKKTIFQCDGTTCQNYGLGEIWYRLENRDGASIVIVVPVSEGSYYRTVDAASYALESWVKTLAYAESIIPPTENGCFVPVYDLYIGRSDAQTNGEVTQLQMWLKNTGYFPDAQGTGYYGEKTAAAVMKWQKAHGMDFVTSKSGVGKQTRAKMKEVCLSATHAQCPQYDSPPVISSIAPSSGPVGTKIELTGCNFLGFESDKNLWIENSRGEKAIIHGERDASNTTLKATLASPLCTGDTSYSGLPCPSYLTLVPGVYSIYSSSWGGMSNRVSFTIK